MSNLAQTARVFLEYMMCNWNVCPVTYHFVNANVEFFKGVRSAGPSAPHVPRLEAVDLGGVGEKAMEEPMVSRGFQHPENLQVLKVYVLYVCAQHIVL